MIMNRYAVDIDSDVMQENKLYVARDTYLDKKVLIKIFSDNKYIRSDFIQNFIDVSTVINDIKSKYILKIENVGGYSSIDKYYYFIVYEYIEGIELPELIKGNYLHAEAVTNIAIEILKALECVNEIDNKILIDGISNINYHGSLKIQDIIVDKEYNIKIADFGITAANKGKNIRANGNYRYMSPHQLCVEYTDYESDLFSFGIILYEMIFKKRPFGEGYDEIDMLNKIDKGPDYKSMTVSKEYNELIEINKKLLSRKNKFKNFKEVILELSNIMYKTSEIEKDLVKKVNDIDKKLKEIEENENKKKEKELLENRNEKIKKGVFTILIIMLLIRIITLL
ncbi:protein kinase domain-containing protein [Peptacetobacter sp.]|uniref:protein kinase domain-containing protein n=1 Tax=Peptacetobacter sp. TaxID=2991975 RepID=UPI00260C9EF4|nr:protein kinase [Peptacetobacter sp.]